MCAGKTSLARLLAGLAGEQLVEVALTSSTDTSDLLGGFEQLEPRRQLQVSAAFPLSEICHALTLQLCC